MIIIWLLAILGVIYKSITLHKKVHISKISTLLYIGMGWLCLSAIQPLFNSLGREGVILSRRHQLYIRNYFLHLKKTKFMHVIWHLFVILGASFMFFSIFFTT